MSVIDGVIAEPMGGAHRDRQAAINATGAAMEEALHPLVAMDGDTLMARRKDKFLALGRQGLG